MSNSFVDTIIELTNQPANPDIDLAYYKGEWINYMELYRRAFENEI